ncbi:MAG: FAD-dependent oxidoreductase [Erysipelotrichales bacterium]|nr:FAD-dependent oxidoreductase [Erysipelotrichales bacterium]
MTKNISRRDFLKSSAVTALGLAATTMLTGCSSNNEPTETNEPTFDETVEYLVLGGGIGGLSSAIEAVDNGCKSVLIVEKQGYVGGAAVVSGGILGGYDTEIAKKHNVSVTVDQLYEEQMREKKYILDPELTRLTIEKSKDTIEWLMNTIGVPFKDEVVQKDGYGTYQAIHLVDGEGHAMREPLEAAIAARPEIEIRLKTRAKKLITNDEGDVLGAIITQEDGTEKKIGAKAVLVATGGFNANHDLFVSTHPANRVFQTSLMAGSTGDGLIMATEVGAGTNSLDQLQVYLREYNNPTSQTPYMYTIFVGTDGKRFMDEKRTAQTYNQEIKDDVIAEYGKTGVDYFYSIADEASLAMMGIADAAKDHVGVIYANTLEELAEKASINKENFVAEIAKWNTFAANQKDDDFNRNTFWFPISTGPYYALQTTWFSSVCHGGITKNANAQVTRFDGSVIKNLYACGEVCVVTNSNGYTISNAITFGRIAAQHVMSQIK